jgi:hypothetical protein
LIRRAPEGTTPNRLVIRRFEQLCRFLEGDPRYNALLAKIARSLNVKKARGAPFPSTKTPPDPEPGWQPIISGL